MKRLMLWTMLGFMAGCGSGEVWEDDPDLLVDDEALASGGLTGRYYDNPDFTNGKFIRTDPTVDFNWDTRSPDSRLGADTYSIRWRGSVAVPTAGSYTFYTTSDDGIRLWVDNQKIIDNWTNHTARENQGVINLGKGLKRIRLDYYENTGRSVARLLWAGPGFSKRVIPASRLYPEAQDDSAQQPGEAKLLFYTGFETGDLTGLKLHTVGGTVKVVASPVASGKYSAQYDLIRIIGKDTYRAETQLLNNTPSFAFGVEYWVGMSYMRTNWATDNDPEIGPLQLHRVPSQWAKPPLPGEKRENVCGGERSAFSVAPFLMYSRDETESIITLGGVRSWETSIVRNRWQNIVFHFKITAADSADASTGYVEAWKDGVFLFRRIGALYTKRNDECDEPWKPTTFNMGIYKWDWWMGNPKPTQSSRRTLYIDNVKIAQGANGCDLVSPQGLGCSTD